VAVTQSINILRASSIGSNPRQLEVVKGTSSLAVYFTVYAEYLLLCSMDGGTEKVFKMVQGKKNDNNNVRKGNETNSKLQKLLKHDRVDWPPYDR